MFLLICADIYDIRFIWWQIYVQEGGGAELRRRVASTSWSPILDPQLSPDACSIAYVRDDELFVVPVAFGEPVQITYGARGTGKVGICIGH